MSLFGDCLERWSPLCRSCDGDEDCGNDDDFDSGDNDGDEDDVRCWW